MNIDQLNAVRIKALETQVACANADANKWCQRATELAEMVDDKDHGIKLLMEANEKLGDRLDVTSDQLDHEIGNRIFHEKRAERLAWFIKHLSEQLQSLDEETDRIKLSEEI